MSKNSWSHWAPRHAARWAAMCICAGLCSAAVATMGCQTTGAASEPAAETPPPAKAEAVAPSARKAAPGDTQTLTFGSGSSALDAAQLATLQTFAHRVTPDAALRVHVVGSSGSSSEETSHKWLAEQRAKNVSSYLTSQGIAPRNVTLEGDSDSTGVADGGEVVVTVR